MAGGEVTGAAVRNDAPDPDDYGLVVRQIGGVVVVGPIAVTQDPASDPWHVDITQPLPAGANTIGFVGIDPANNDVDVLSLPPVTQGTTPWIVDDGGGSITVDQGTSPWVIAGNVAVVGNVTVDQGTNPWVVGDGGGSLTVDTLQLPAALVGGRLDNNIGSWFGSTAPTVGQKVAASSIPVVLASNSTPIVVLSPTSAGIGTDNAAPSAGVMQVAGIGIVGDFANHQLAMYDLNTTAAEEYVLGVNLRSSSAGTSEELLGQKTMAASLPVAIASNQSAIPVTDTPTEATVTSVLAALNATAVLAVTGGRQTIGFDIDNLGPGGLIGTLRARATTLSGSFVDTCYFAVRGAALGLDAVDGTKVATLVLSGNAVRITGTILVPAGCTSVEIRVTAFTSGSCTARINAGFVDGDETLTDSILGQVLPPFATLIGGSDGTNIQALRVFDLDTGGGTQFSQGVSLRKAASGGSVELGTVADPINIQDSTTGTLNNGAQTAVSNVAVSVLASNASRKAAIIQNVGAASVRLGVAGVGATTGIQLVAGATMILEKPYGVTGQLFAIREGGADSTVFATEIT